MTTVLQRPDLGRLIQMSGEIVDQLPASLRHHDGVAAGFHHQHSGVLWEASGQRCALDEACEIAPELFASWT